MPIEAQIGQLGKMTISIGMKQTKTNGIETAIQNIKHMSDCITTSKGEFVKNQQCSKATRV